MRNTTGRVVRPQPWGRAACALCEGRSYALTARGAELNLTITLGYGTQELTKAGRLCTTCLIAVSSWFNLDSAFHGGRR
jgi:hypothetical protein